jgi:hypothetical protein
MTLEEYDRWAESIVQELLDQETSAAWGDEAGFLLSFELGLMDGDVVEIDGDGQVILETPLAEIEANIQRAREAKARGVPMFEHLSA